MRFLSIAFVRPIRRASIFRPLLASESVSHSDGGRERECADDHRIIKQSLLYSSSSPSASSLAPISFNPLSPSLWMFCAVCVMMVTNKNRQLPRPLASAPAASCANARTYSERAAQSSMIATGKKWAAAMEGGDGGGVIFALFRQQLSRCTTRSEISHLVNLKRALFHLREDGGFFRNLFLDRKSVMWSDCCCDAEKCNSFNGSRGHGGHACRRRRLFLL